METPDRDAETYETIPWAQLVPQETSLVTRVASWVGGALVAVVLALVLITVLRDEPKQTVVTLDAPPVAAAVEVPEETAPITTAPSSPQPEAAMLYSEADLMAVAPEEDQRSAAMRAVWFVTDYFTLDGDSQTAADVRAALPAGVDVVLPHDRGGGVSYVEWAHAIAVRSAGPATYSVDVAFRTLQGSGDSELVRQPVTAVRVRVAMMPDGGAAVLDLPEPLPLTHATAEVATPPVADPPPEVVAQLAAAVAGLGIPGDIVEAGLDASGWRIVLTVRGPSGLEWPLTVRP